MKNIQPASVDRIRIWGAAGVVLLFAVAVRAQRQQPVPPSPVPTTVEHVRGVVVNSLDQKPIARALVTSGDQRLAVMTDDYGRFSFDMRHPVQQATGPYGYPQQRQMIFLQARRPGYSPGNFQEQVAFDDQGAKDLTLKLVPECVLRGHVSVSSGDLPNGLFVQLRRKTVQDGSGIWMQANGTQVNSRGDFRISELQPGEYKVMVQARTLRGINMQQPTGDSPGYLPAFNGGASDLASATPIVLGAGQTVEVNLDMRAATFYRVSIPVANVPAGAGFNVSVRTEGGTDDNDMNSSGFQLMVNAPTQRIEALLPNGAYEVRVTGFVSTPVKPAVGTDVRRTGQQMLQTMTTGSGKVEVGGALAQVPTITLGPAGTIPVNVHEDFTAVQANASQSQGRVSSVITGGSDFLPVSGRVAIRPVEIWMRTAGLMGRGAGLRNSTSPDDPLVLENVTEGTYQVTASARRGYIASMSSNGIDLLQQPLVVGPGGASGAIEVTLRDDGAKLTGTVINAGGGPVVGGNLPMFVQGIPLGEAFGPVLMSGFGGSGKFTFQNVRPGQYLLLASRTQLQNVEFRNPDVLKGLQLKGTVVTLGAGQQVDVQVPMLDEGE